MQNLSAPYTPRNPRLSDYYRCGEDYFEELERVHEARYQARLGYLRPEIRLTIFRYTANGLKLSLFDFVGWVSSLIA